MNKMTNPKKIIDTINEYDVLNKALKDAKLHVVQWKPYCWLEVWDMSYYFHGSGNNEAIEEEYKTMTWHKNKKYIIPYDGYEYWLS